MTFTGIAYPLLVGYSFGLLAALALLVAIARRGQFKENGFLIAALATLAGLYAAGVLETHEHIAGLYDWRWPFKAAALRLLFAGFAIADVTRVVLALGRDRISPEDARLARLGPALWFLFAAILGGIGVFSDTPEKRFFPVAAWFGAVNLSLTFLRILKVLRPADEKPAGFWSSLANPNPKPLISLDLSPHPRYSTSTLTPLISAVEARNLKSLVWLTVAVVLPAMFQELFANQARTPAMMLANLTFALSMLPCFFGLIQFHARSLFFDVVVKQGILGMFLALAWAIALPLLLTGSLAVEQLTLLVVAVVLLNAAWIGLYHHGATWLDRLIFHRPDYREVLEAVTTGMTQHATEDQLSKYVAERVAEAMRADWVEFRSGIDKPASAAVRIASGDRVFGYLLCGPRYRSQPYRSEDLQFLETIGAHFGGSLQSFETQRMEELAARSELKALRAQINPHFLFNALNTLADMTHTSPEAEKTILNLARVFRFALDSTRRETVPLRDELAFIRSYLEIEKARFESKLRFSIEAPDNLLDRPVPAMLMQPLVENAIKHGLAQKTGGGWVRVTVTPSTNGLTIKVEDNGVGFDPAKVQPNVGMSNVQRRVEGAGGGWWVDTAVGKGTSITFEVPEPREGVAA